MKKEQFKVLLREAEDAYPNAPAKGYRQVGEKLFDASYNKANNSLNTNNFSIKAMTEAALEYKLGISGGVNVGGQNGWDLVKEYEGDARFMETVTTGAIPTIIGTVLEKTMIESYNYHTGPYNTLVREIDWTGKDTTKATIPGMQAFSDFKERAEGTPYLQSGLKEKYAEVYLKDFGRIIALTWEAVVSDETGLLVERAQSLGEAGAFHRNQMIVQSVEMIAARSTMGETATKACNLNGTTLLQAGVYATTHAAVTGTDLQVNANLVATNKALDYDGIDEAWGLARKMTDEKGAYINVVPNALLVYATQAAKAWNLMNTNMQPGTAEFNSNFYYKKFNIIDTPYLSDTNSWYLGDFPKQVVWMWVARPASLTKGTESDAFFTSKIIKQWRFSYHGGCGMRDYRYIIRSAGES